MANLYKRKMVLHGDQNQNLQIQMAKITIPVDIVCKDLPTEFKELLIYCRTLEYEQQPDYHYMQDTLRKVLKDLPKSERSLPIT